MCVLPKCLLRRSVIAVSFRCDVIGCQLARKGVRRGATEASGGVERMWAWQRGRSDLDRGNFSTTTTFCCYLFYSTPPSCGSVAKWLACWTQAQKGPGSNRSRDAFG